MLDIFLETILEIILDGMTEAVDNKKVPLAFRIMLALILLILIFGVCGFLIYSGIETGNTALAVLGTLLIVIFAVLIIVKVKNIKRNGHK